jgi:hypothetical protein
MNSLKLSAKEIMAKNGALLAIEGDEEIEFDFEADDSTDGPTVLLRYLVRATG